MNVTGVEPWIPTSGMFRLLATAVSVSAVLVVLPPFSWIVSAPFALLNVLPSYRRW